MTPTPVVAAMPATPGGAADVLLDVLHRPDGPASASSSSRAAARPARTQPAPLPQLAEQRIAEDGEVGIVLVRPAGRDRELLGERDDDVVDERHRLPLAPCGHPVRHALRHRRSTRPCPRRLPRIATSPRTPAGTSVTEPGQRPAVGHREARTVREGLASRTHEEQRLRRQRREFRDVQHREIALQRERRMGRNTARELGVTEELPSAPSACGRASPWRHPTAL